jgi:hypothetical protein
MRKLLLILLAFIAVFTYIRTIENADAAEPPVSEFVNADPHSGGSTVEIVH